MYLALLDVMYANAEKSDDEIGSPDGEVARSGSYINTIVISPA